MSQYDAKTAYKRWAAVLDEISERTVGVMRYCSRCGDELMFSARKRGDGLCGPCSRGEVWTGDLRGLLDGPSVTKDGAPWKSATPEEIMADLATLSSAPPAKRVIVKYRCGPWPDAGCGQVFAVEEDEDSLSAPMRCPLCGKTFCGYDCCGNVAEVIDDGSVIERSPL